MKVNGSIPQECARIDFHDKHYLGVDDTLDGHRQGRMINFNIGIGHNDPKLVWKKNKHKKNRLLVLPLQL